jgi:endonuclease YncB( thermonuclease family)
MLRNALDRIAAHPLWMQTLLYLVLYLAALFVFGLLALLSPFVMILAGLVLVAAIFALVVRFLKHRPLRRWALVALTSLVLLLVFMGISNALYFSAQPDQADSTKPDKQTSKPYAKPGSPEQATKHEGFERPNRGQRDTDQADAKAQGRPSAAGNDTAEGTQPTAVVTRVVDGDTIEIAPSVDGKGTVTLVGIDAPEGKKPACGPQPLAQDAADHASLWVGRKVRLEFDQERTDEYGQLLAYVHDAKTGEMMNVDMVRSGYAQVYVVPPNTKHEDELRKAQDQAKSASSGLVTGIWSLPPAEAAQLADHGNGIGYREGACSPGSQIPRPASSSSASSSASPSPSPNPNQNVPSPNTLNPNATSSASSSASPAAGGSSSSASPAAGGG